MNNIADFIPAMILVSAGLAVIVAAGLMWFEHIAQRATGEGYQPLRQAPLPRAAVLLQHQDATAAPANAGDDLKAAA